MLRQAAVERIVEEVLVLRADVQRDREAGIRVYTGAGGIERQLANRDAHAVGAEIAKAENALAVGHHDDANRSVRPVAQHVGDAPAIAGTDEQAVRAPPDVPEHLARAPDRRRVDDRHHFVDVIDDHAVEQPLVSILQRDQIDVLLEVRGLGAKVLEDLLDLLGLRQNARRQQSVQLECVALVVGERRSLVEGGVVQHLYTGGHRLVRSCSHTSLVSRVRYSHLTVVHG
jgi:hypothetical protein